MKLWKPAVCLFLSGLLLSACAAPAGEGGSAPESEAVSASARRQPPWSPAWTWRSWG